MVLYPLIRDRVLRTKHRDCKFLPDKNPEFVVAMAFVGHHVPCIVIIVCYAVVYYEIRRLIKTRPQDLNAVALKLKRVVILQPIGLQLLQLSTSSLYFSTSTIRFRRPGFMSYHYVDSLASRLGLKTKKSSVYHLEIALQLHPTARREIHRWRVTSLRIKLLRKKRRE